MEDLKSRFPDGDIGITYIYCDFTQRANQTPELMLASILQQLAYQRLNLSPGIDSLYEKFQDEGKRPTFTEYLSGILSMSEEFSTVFVVFDALDECDEKTQRSDLFLALKQLSRAPFKILATSRPHPSDIQTAFEGAKLARIHAHNNDIEIFVRGRIEQEQSRGITIKPDLASEIVNQILLKAEGM